MDRKRIIHFVRETLGCTCPDEVFQHIECQTEIRAGENLILDYEINIGNKLLVLIATVGEVDLLRTVLSQLVLAGMKERDKHGFNRFRLVLQTQKVESVENKALDIFHSLNPDEKVHLHVVKQGSLS